MLILLILSTCMVPSERVSDNLTGPEMYPIELQSQVPAAGSIFDDFITSVYAAPAEQKQVLVDSFILWADSTTGIPFIEDSTAYFLFRKQQQMDIRVAGDFNGWSPGSTFNRLSGTNLYYRSYTFESDARQDYKYVVGESWILDPLNPHTCSGGWGPNSELSMPDYIQPDEIQVYDIPHGELISTTFSDTTQGKTRNIKIYLPPGYDAGQLRYRTAYFLDGGEYVNLASAGNILDYMIYHEQIPPIIAVFTDPTDRNVEYRYDLEFMKMFVSELVPWIDSDYRTMPEAQHRAINGVSLGGLTSLLFTISHPEVFQNCGAFSPAVWIDDLVAQYRDADSQITKIYMDAGTYEPSIYNPSLELHHILENKGWDHKWFVWHEGHSWGSWRAHLDEALTFFWPLHTTGIDESY